MKKVFFFIFLLSLIAFSRPEGAFAGTSQNVSGYAWSSNIGWISFNCTNDSSCGTADYGVNMNGDGTLVGYAWSSTIGWIQFGSLAGFPSGTGTYSQNAQVVGSTLRGWARAISQDGAGWDGWISLSGSSPTYGVSYSGTTFSGYAWGSDVIGWILFDIQNVYPAICSNCGMKLSGDATLDIQSGGVSIVGNWAVPYNTGPTFIWTLTSIPSATCSVSRAASSTGASTFATTSITSSGTSYPPGPSHTTGLYTYQLDCVNPTISKQVGFGIAAQPAGFSLGATETAAIQFIASTTANSELKTFFVSAVGGFTSNVSVSVSNSTCPASAKFSLGGQTFKTMAQVPTAVSVAYNGGSTFQARLAQAISGSCTVTLYGTGSGANASKDYIINPTIVSPSFEEH